MIEGECAQGVGGFGDEERAAWAPGGPLGTSSAVARVSSIPLMKGIGPAFFFRVVYTGREERIGGLS